MARYFFHLRDGDTLLPDDDEGEELRDLALLWQICFRPRAAERSSAVRASL